MRELVLSVVLLACSSPHEVDEAAVRRRLSPVWTPINERLATAADGLPPPGTVPDGRVVALDPPLRYRRGPRDDDGTHQLPENFVFMDVEHLTTPEVRSRPGEFIWKPPLFFTNCMDAASDGYITQATERICRDEAEREYVVALRDVSFRAPRVGRDVTEFEPGAIDLEGFVLRLATGVVERQFRVRATNREDFDFSEARPDRYRTRTESYTVSAGRLGRRRRTRTVRERVPGLHPRDLAASDLEFSAIDTVREYLRPVSVGLLPTESRERDRPR